MSYVEEERARDHPQTESEVVADAVRGKASIDVAYPEKGKKDVFIPYVARYRGVEPDFYDAYAAGVYFEVIRCERLRLQATYRHVPAEPKATEFKWENVMRHFLVQTLEEHTISLGGGKGRKEAVELGKSQAQVPRRSRWSLRGRE